MFEAVLFVVESEAVQGVPEKLDAGDVAGVLGVGVVVHVVAGVLGGVLAGILAGVDGALKMAFLASTFSRRTWSEILLISLRDCDRCGIPVTSAGMGANKASPSSFRLPFRGRFCRGGNLFVRRDAMIEVFVVATGFKQSGKGMVGLTRESWSHRYLMRASSTVRAP